MSEPTPPDRCYDCGGLRKPSAFDQAICRCGRANYAGRFYPAKSESADTPTFGQVLTDPLPIGAVARGREIAVRGVDRVLRSQP